MIFYIENPADSTKKTVRINKPSRVAGYKMNIQKSVEFLHTNNKLLERKIKKTIPSAISSKKVKYSGIN